MRYLVNLFICCSLFGAEKVDFRHTTTGMLESVQDENIVVDIQSVTVPGPSALVDLIAAVTAAGSSNGLKITWEFISGPGNVSLTTVEGPTNLAQVAAQGVYRMKVVGTNGKLTNYREFQIFIVDQGITNFVPTIVLTSPPNGAIYTAPIDLILLANAQDKDGTITNVVFYNGTTPLWTSTVAPFSFTLTNASATNYVFAATAWDNRGATNQSISYSVIVKPPVIPPVNTNPIVSITSPANGLTFTNPVTIPFTVNASDPDGTISSVTFSTNGVIIFTDLDSPYGITFTPSTGTNQLVVIATDNSGGMTFKTNTITVVDPVIPNIVPLAIITSPTNSQVYTNPASFTVTVNATDNDGTITSVEMFKDGISLGTDSSSPYSFASSVLGIGTFTFTALATDNDGGVGVSSNIVITVVPAPGIPPVVSLTTPTNGQVFIQGSTITLSVTATDSDGTVTNVSWYSVTPESPPDPENTNQSISTFIIGDPTSPFSKTWTPLANSYGIIAIAADNTGLRSTTSVATITVRLPISPLVNLTSPTNGQVFSQGASIPLAASLNDPDGLVSGGVAFWQFQPDSLISTDTTFPYTGSWNTAPTNNSALVAKVTYGVTNVVSSPAINIIVTPTPPQTVYVDAGSGKTATLSTYRDYVDSEKIASIGQFNNYASSSLGVNKYDLQYIWTAYRDMYLATLETNYINQALIWAEMAVASATVTDSNGNKNWTGPWTPNPYSATSLSYELYDIQGGSGMSTVVRTILTDPELRAVYGARATLVYNFIRDQIVNKVLIIRNGLPWYRNFLHDPKTGTTDKAELVLGMLLDLKLSSTALGNNDNITKGYPALVDEFAGGMKDYNGITPCFTTWCLPSAPSRCGLIWQKGHTWQQWLVFDTSHAERIPDVLIDCYENGQTFDFSYIQGLANLFTKVIWDQSTTSPQFNNFIDGSNVTFLNRGPYADGKIYAGWSMLSKYDSQALLVAQYTLAAIRAGVVNPSLTYNNTFLGRTALASRIARAVTFRGQPPYAKLDGIVQGSGITATNWTHIAGPTGYRIVKTNSANSLVTFTSAGVGTHTFRLTVTTSTGSVSDDVNIIVNNSGGTTTPSSNIFQQRIIYARAGLGDPVTGLAEYTRLTNVMYTGANLGWNALTLDESDCIKQNAPSATCLNRLASVKSLAAMLGMAIIPSSFTQGEPPKTSPIEIREGFPVIDSKFLVNGITALPIGDPAPVVLNGGFESFSGNQPTSWNPVDDPGITTFIDTAVKHSGTASIRLQNTHVDPNRGRVSQDFTVTPFRAYKISAWIKTQSYPSSGAIKFFIQSKNTNKRILFDNRDNKLGTANATGTQDWTFYQADFNSLDSTSLTIYLMAPANATTGQIWFDDVSLVEIGLRSMVRRSSTPITVKNLAGTTTYTEGVNYVIGNEVLTSISGIPNGTTLKVSWYQLAATAETASIPGTACNNEFFSAFTTNYNNIISRLGSLKGAHVRYDEWRSGNWDPSCGYSTMGQYLSNATFKVSSIIRNVDPTTRQYFWNDMYDPYHNALPTYYMCNGTVVGSWNGLPNDAVIFNWFNNGNTSNLRFWAGLDATYPIAPRNQIIAGYYESTSNVADWLTLLAQAEQQGVHNVVGFMYTTFANDAQGLPGRYTDLQAVTTQLINAGRWGTGPAF